MCCCVDETKPVPAPWQVAVVSAASDALVKVKSLLKEWRPPLNADPQQEARLISEVRAALSAQDEAAAADGLLAAAHGIAAGSSSSSGGISGQADKDVQPPAPKRQRTAGTLALQAKLFKVTESGNLVPSGAETLCKRVGEATDDAGAVVPEVNQPTLARYRAIGCVCALALVNNQTLALPFAQYFLRLVLREPPKGLEDLQAELRAEDPSNLLGKAGFLQYPLAEMGMDDGMLTFDREASMMTVPLARHASKEVTDENKMEYLRRRLEHQLVLTIEAQANAFREGVEAVAGVGWLPLLSAKELQLIWGGHAIDDAHLEIWRSKTNYGGGRGAQRGGTPSVAQLFWQWLGASSEAKRAEVLQFATGASRLPCESQLAAWTFHIEVLDSSQVSTIERTASNGLSAPAMLARASTCSKTIQLPPYEDVEALARGLEYSLMDGGFGVA